jgi:AbrB family looped-hinge helix DNA binding protein
MAGIYVVTVTSKGQATIPKELREEFGIERKVIFEGGEGVILLKPAPEPLKDVGMFHHLAKGRTAAQLLKADEKEETDREQRLTRSRSR